jgi:PD-(D/E)XK nuclease superfamily
VTLSIEQIADLFAGLKNLPKAVNREQTFMEIAGYPHFENVCSNILAFYLQPNNNHGFGPLFLDVLATLINEEIEIDGQGVEVRREEPTKKGNRIDLVIKSDNYVFGIENKIYADLNNPFCDYSKHLDSLSEGRKKIHKILLSLRSVQPSPQLYDFYPISYQIFFQKVMASIGPSFLTGHEPHATFLRDFIQTIQNLQQSNTMDLQRLEYFRSNQQSITALLDEVDNFRQDMRMKTQQLKEIVNCEDISTYNISSGLWTSSKNLVAANLYIIKVNDSFWLQLDLLLTPEGWKMQFFNGNSKGSLEQVREWLKERDVEFETSIGNPWRLIYTGVKNSHPYETEIEDIRMWTIDMLKRLTTSTADRSIDSNTSFTNLIPADQSNPPSLQPANRSASTTSVPCGTQNVIKLN